MDEVSEVSSENQSFRIDSTRGQLATTGGIGAILSKFVSWQSTWLTPDSFEMLQMFVPALSIMISLLIQYIYKEGDELLELRRLQRAKKRARSVLSDEFASEDAKRDAQLQYDQYCRIEASIGFSLNLGHSSSTKETVQP